jgi:hypothetical protein
MRLAVPLVWLQMVTFVLTKAFENNIEEYKIGLFPHFREVCTKRFRNCGKITTMVYRMHQLVSIWLLGWSQDFSRKGIHPGVHRHRCRPLCIGQLIDRYLNQTAGFSGSNQGIPACAPRFQVQFRKPWFAAGCRA